MKVFSTIFVTGYALFKATVSYGQPIPIHSLPVCNPDGQFSWVSVDSNSGMAIVPMGPNDPNNASHSYFQVWNLNTKSLVSEDKAPKFAVNKVLGFPDSHTIDFLVYNGWNPSLLRYDLNSQDSQIRWVAKEALSVGQLSYSAKIAFLGTMYTIDLETGNLIPLSNYQIQHSSPGNFSVDGKEYYSFGYISANLDNIKLFASNVPDFSSNSVLASFSRSEVSVGFPNSQSSLIKAFVVDIDSGLQSIVFSTQASIDQNPQHPAGTTVNAVHLYDKISKKHFNCNVPIVASQVKFFDESKNTVFVFEGGFTNPHGIPLILNMESCEITQSPYMPGLTDQQSVAFRPKLGWLKSRPILYNVTGVWDLISGENLIRTCRYPFE